MHLVCFEDRGVESMSPVTTSRPAFSIQCGGYRLLDWIKDVAAVHRAKVCASVRPFLKTCCELDDDLVCVDASNGHQIRGDRVWMINARLVPTVALRDALMLLADESGPVMFRDKDGAVMIAKLSANEWSQLVDDSSKSGSLADSLESFANDATPHWLPDGVANQSLVLFHWPHDIVRFHLTAIADAMAYRIQTGDYREISDGVFAAEDVVIGPQCVFDTTDGPIVLDPHVRVGPMSYLAGPIYVGPRVRIIEHSSIKDAVTIGHTCKVGGEIEASIIEPYTNKQHHGFLGHSYLGRWINIGAGTSNSDLKNTYGKINVTRGDQKIATDMQFFGCVIGDYSKAAINTSIFTGKSIGVCSMMYGFVTEDVPSFVNYAKSFGQSSAVPAEVMISTQKRMFARRGVEHRSCDEQLIRDMHGMTAAERGEYPNLL